MKIALVLAITLFTILTYAKETTLEVAVLNEIVTNPTAILNLAG